MNRFSFRLVRDRLRGVLVPVAETSRARHGCGRAVRTVLATSIAAVVVPSSVLAADPLPVGTLPVAAANWAGSAGTQATLSVDGSTMRIDQISGKAILNWDSFNVAAGSTVRFVQPDANATALNRIFDANASVIQGQINANGQVFLINQNGILFDRGSQINVHTLVASSLNISDADFANGLLAPGREAVARPAFTAFPTGATGSILIEAQATLQSAKAGKVMIFAPAIENRGVIRSPDGQVMLAAGSKVYLMASEDANLRGLLVEVDVPESGSTVTNLGEIMADRGNATLIGLAVNQGNRVTATTAVNANGSIRLLARAAPAANSDLSISPQRVVATRTGTVTLAAGSRTEVALDTTDATTVERSAAFDATGAATTPSRVEVMGKVVSLETGSRILAPGGIVRVTALDNPFEFGDTSGTFITTAISPTARVHMAPGAIIDVSGADASVALSRYQLRVDLRNQLRDSPLQRSGVLRGTTVNIDATRGTTVADIGADLANLQVGLAQKFAAGGQVILKSQGDVVLREGATIDVSGGVVSVAGGTLLTTQLMSNGRLYDISTAPKDIVYSAVSPVDRVRVVQPYSEGRDAGTITIVGSGIVAQSTLVGRTFAGEYQRTAATLPRSGSLVLGESAQVTAADPDFRLGSVRFDGVVSRTEVGLADPLPADYVTTFSAQSLDEGGIDRLGVYANGRVTFATPGGLQLGSFGQLTVVAGAVDLLTNVVAPGGNVSVESILTTGNGAVYGPVTLGAGATLDVSGRWVNENPVFGAVANAGTVVNDGGSVRLRSAGDLRLLAGSRIDVGGGARRLANGTIVAGNAGSIELAVHQVAPGRQLQSVAALEIASDAVLNGLAMGKGGTLRLTANAITVGSARLGTDAAELLLPTSLFANHGFASFALTANSGDFTVRDGVQLAPSILHWTPGRTVTTAGTPSGRRFEEFAYLALRQPGERDAATFSATVNPLFAPDFARAGRLVVEAGASITTDVGGQLSFLSGTSMQIDGRLSAQAGVISLQLAAPPERIDPGYSPTQIIAFGAGAEVVARGAVVLDPSVGSAVTGVVRSGGSIDVRATRGFIVAAPTARFDVSGTVGEIDVQDAAGSLSRMSVPSAAGSLRMAAAEGIQADAVFLGGAGGAGVAGGTFEVVLARGANIIGAPGTDRIVTLDRGDAIRGSLASGDAKINLDRVMAGGFDALDIRAETRIELASMGRPLDVAFARRISLDAPIIELTGDGAGTALRTAYASLGNAERTLQTVATTATGGERTLAIEASLIDFVGAVAVRGADRVEAVSRGEVRLRGVVENVTAPTAVPGRLAVAGTLDVSASQVYPTTLSRYTLEAGRAIVIRGNGSDAAVPLSAGGNVTMVAPGIEIAGTVRAPLGTIELRATGPADPLKANLTVGPTGRLSVSAEGATIPFGLVQNGIDWIYDLGPRDLAIVAPPAKQIRLTGAGLSLDSGAILDVTGGGDLLAYEFLPGPNGTVDVLAPGGGWYAVLPSLRSDTAASDRFGPHDLQYHADTDLSPGDAVWLSGVPSEVGRPGLAAGRYVLLPARYALLDGAWLVRPTTGYTDLAPSMALRAPDGTSVIAGRAVAAGTDLGSARYEGFEVRPGTLARNDAQYDLYHAATFFAPVAGRTQTITPRLPIDAGLLSVSALASLRLDAELRGSAGTMTVTDPATGSRSTRTGRGAQVDISAQKLQILAAGGTAGAGYVGIEGTRLTALGAESLLVGGRRERLVDGIHLDVDADEVQVDSGAVIVAPEVMLASRGTVTVMTGSRMAAVGGVVTPEAPLIVGETGSGDGAFLRASTGSLAVFERRNTTTHTGVPARDALIPGVIRVQSGAVVAAAGSLELDATGDTKVLGGTLLPGKGALSLGASRVSLGQVAGKGLESADEPGLVLDTEAMATVFGELSSLRLRSYTSIDFHGVVTLGRESLAQLSLDSGALSVQATDGVSMARVVASNVVVGNGTGLTQETTGGAGALAIESTHVLTLAPGTVRTRGADAVVLQAGDRITGTDTGSFESASRLELRTAVITTDGGANRRIGTSGELTTTAIGAAPAARAQGLGGALALTGGTVVHGGRVDMASGRITLRATAGDVRLVEGSVVNAGGIARTFGESVAYSDGGAVTLASTAGGVRVDVGARVDVSAAPGGGDAGTLLLSAPGGSVFVAGALQGVAGTRGVGGHLGVDAGAVADSGLLARLATGGGFSGAFELRARTGDLVLGAGDRIVARHIALVADRGALDVAGAVDASTGGGGRVELWARDDVQLRATATVSAAATDVGDGGEVVIGTTAGRVEVASGARIDVSSGAAGTGGTVHVRAPRTGSGGGNDIAVTRFAADVEGASSVTFEGFKAYTDSSIATADTTQTAVWFREAADFMSNTAAMRVRLGLGTDPSYRIVPGLEIGSAGDLTLANDWSLHAWRYDALTGSTTASAAQLTSGVSPEDNPLVGGVLTLRAQGGLRFSASLSDGFNGALATSAINTARDSWSYRLVAGADPMGVDPLAVSASASGSIVIAGGTRTAAGDVPTSVRQIRTGTGDIEIATSGDLTLTNAQSVIYTAGRAIQRRAGTIGNTAVYADEGGDVRIDVGGSIRGAKTDQVVTGWLHREGDRLAPAAWWVDFRFFQQGVGALGGGDVLIRAGGDIDTLSASVPTSHQPNAAQDLGGGDVTVTAGGSIFGGTFHAGDGDIALVASGAIGRKSAASSSDFPLNPMIALGTGTVSLKAVGDLTLESVFNPTVVLQSLEQNRLAPPPRKSYFFTYGPEDSVAVTSLNGDVTLSNNITAMTRTQNFAQDASRNNTSFIAQRSEQALIVYPSRLSVVALQGDVRLNGNSGMTLFPSASGDLTVLARGDVVSTTELNVSDADPGRLPGVSNPSAAYRDAAIERLLNPRVSYLFNHASVPVHLGDTTRSAVVALDGSVQGGIWYINKAATFRAGQDVEDVQLYLQHANDTDSSSIVAGRDIRFGSPRDAQNRLLQNLGTLSVAGPGRLLVQAGRDVDLGTSEGIVSLGNTVNPALPAAGASLSVVAGAPTAIDRAAFAARVLPQFQANDSKALRELTRSLRIARQSPGLTESEVLAMVEASPERYAEDLFFTALALAGRAADYDAGIALGNALISPDTKADGDLNLYFSQIKTRVAADIHLFAPGGGINAGLAVPPGDLTKTADRLGIVAQGEGRVRAFVRDDVIVNQSRIFTLRGGDILLWSSEGDIDAGRGAKSVVSTPPPVLITDVNGNTSFSFQGASVGSGIRIQLTVEGEDAGVVDLFAPRGEVRAGDAGIVSAGDINIVAVRVVGADNIAAGGTATGVPAVVAPAAPVAAPSGSLSDASRSVEQATQSAASSAASARKVGVFITVQVVGLGDGEDDRSVR